MADVFCTCTMKHVEIILRGRFGQSEKQGGAECN
jgi:hypothetical protein